MAPTVSVVMSVYNCASYLGEAIESILSQSFEDFEFLIIDDASTDNTREVLSEFRDLRIKTYFNHKNCGLAYSLNFLLQKASGKFIARMDGDDIALPERFSHQVALMESDPNLILLGTNCFFVNERSEFIRMGVPFLNERKDLSDEFIRWSLHFPENMLVHPSVMMRRDLLEQNRLFYKNDLRCAQDIEFWCRLANFGKLKIIGKPLLKLRILGESLTSKRNFEQIQISLNCAKAYQEKMLGVEINNVCGQEHLGNLFRNFCSKFPEASTNQQIREDFCRRLIKESVLPGNIGKTSIRRFLFELKQARIGLSEMLLSALTLVKSKIFYLMCEKRKILQFPKNSQ